MSEDEDVQEDVQADVQPEQLQRVVAEAEVKDPQEGAPEAEVEALEAPEAQTEAPEAKKPQKKSAKQDRTGDYEAIRGEVEKPTSDRDKLETRRGNMRIPRRYHLTDKKMQKLVEQAEKDGSFPNPYRKGGIYHAIVQALANLGANTRHSFADMKAKIEEIMGEYETKKGGSAWSAFANRESRNELSGKDVDGKILQNAMVLQRLSGYHLYGEKLRQLCACIDIFKDAEGLPLLSLNTSYDKPEDVQPVNELRRSSKKKS